MDNMWLTAAIWMALALAASLFSIWLGITVAILEIIFGVLAGNALGLHTTPWIDALGNFGIVLLSFLAGAEIDSKSLKQNLKPSLVIGLSSFAVPFIGVFLFAHYVTNWEIRAALIAGLALSTTSVAIVYTTLLENGMSATGVGKTMLSATLVTDISTMLTLGFFSAEANPWLVVYVLVLFISLMALPRFMPWVNHKIGNKFGQPYIKLVLVILLFLSWLATQANSQPVLPAFILGIVLADGLSNYKSTIDRIQIITFTVLIPFYFLKAGSMLSVPAMISGLGWVLVLLFLKVALKFLGILPLSRIFGWTNRQGTYASLLMSTGLTFGTISAVFGYNSNLIDQSQYTVLLSGIIGSALVPAIIAQAWFKPANPVKSGDKAMADCPEDTD